MFLSIYHLIHVYDYPGADYGGFIKGLDWKKTQNKIAMSFIKPTLKLLGKPRFDFNDYLRTIKLRIKSNWS